MLFINHVINHSDNLPVPEAPYLKIQESVTASPVVYTVPTEALIAEEGGRVRCGLGGVLVGSWWGREIYNRLDHLGWLSE